MVALAIGSQFPDLIDKPFAWTLGLLPGGRTLTHSVFVAALLLPIAYSLARRFGWPEAGMAFAIGHASHLLSDIPPTAILDRDLSATTFLFWPILEPPQYQTPGSILAGFLRYSMGWYEWVQLGLVVVALIAWYYDGAPGLGYGRRALERITGNRGLSEPER
ncbi:membrane-bound metal-dependent hydrolase [Natrinema pellirubrum DSM 15624]|uniref:Membrane-bound metal-dependent hydrolase n=1 Tax=Natrinema pellirubrum (strain DSM 15624 / CIP 106293 / JCM 10476 / NCIMB 786 / 157) TaxID=797303 RepID=L9YUK8_NATP1|nr:membrane-bound metal-dependent hydrolase [Natrinema pellirubrum DSM 15624]